jgi:hypothetical protein
VVDWRWRAGLPLRLVVAVPMDPPACIGRGVEGRPQSGRRRSASSPARLPVVAARQLLRGRAAARLASALGTARARPRPPFMGTGHAHGRGGGGLDYWPCPP